MLSLLNFKTNPYFIHESTCREMFKIIIFQALLEKFLATTFFKVPLWVEKLQSSIYFILLQEILTKPCETFST
jgi:hypothetical protein